MRLIVAITGATGVIYGVRLLERLREAGVETHLVISRWGARTLLHDPSVLFLDEPTIGLDPVGAREFRQVILNLQSQRKTILLTTHYMFEADQLCDRIAVIDDGRLITRLAGA
jgi:ABC-2 type transport system ATP-binding protein